MNKEQEIVSVWKMLRYSYGVVVLLAGLDKVLSLNLIANWENYVSPLVADSLPMSPQGFMVIVGIIEVLVAVLILTKFTRLAFYLATVWLILIAINLLILGGYVDVAVRDVLLAVGAFATAKLAAINGYGLSGKMNA